MTDYNPQPLIAYLIGCGGFEAQELTWPQLAEKFKISNSDAASARWYRFTGSEKGKKFRKESNSIPFSSKTESADQISTETYSERPITPEQQAIYHNIDTTIFEPGEMKTNYWEVGMKVKVARVVDGVEKYVEEPITRPLHQLTVKWVKRKVELIVQADRDDIERLCAQKHFEAPTSSSHRTYLVLGCVHRPFHHKVIWNAIMSFIKDNRDSLHGIILNGDYLDLRSLSGHDEFNVLPDGIDLGFEYKDGYEGIMDIKAAFGPEKFDEVEKYFHYGNHCFSSDTELLTENGWMDMDAFLKSEGARVASVNPETMEMSFSNPLGFVSREYDGEMHHWNGKKYDILATPEHKMFALQALSYRPFFSKSSELTQCTRFAVSVNNTNREFDISDNEIRLAAWIHTDGHFTKSHHYCRIYQSKPDGILKIREILDNLGVKYTEKIRNRSIAFVDGKKLKKDPLPHYEFQINANQQMPVLNKEIVDGWIHRLSKRQFDVFLDSLIDGDGSRHKSAPETSLMLYGKKDFLSEIQKLCFANGHSSSLSTYNRCQYRLNIHRNKSNTKVNSSKSFTNVLKVDYNGMVWCVTTKDGTVVVRRNGKVSVQGNCDRYFRHIKQAKNAKYGEALMAPHKALNLEELGFKVQVDWRNGATIIGDTEVCHGFYTGPNAMKKHLEATDKNVYFNHTHAIGEFKMGGRMAYNGGWLGDEKSAGFRYASRFQFATWQKSFGLINLLPNGKTNIVRVNCDDEGFFIGGKRY